MAEGTPGSDVMGSANVEEKGRGPEVNQRQTFAVSYSPPMLSVPWMDIGDSDS